jgi:hypothetical protein
VFSNWHVWAGAISAGILSIPVFIQLKKSAEKMAELKGTYNLIVK